MNWQFEDNQQGSIRLWLIKQALRLAASKPYHEVIDQTLLAELSTEVESLLQHEDFAKHTQSLQDIELSDTALSDKSLKDYLSQFFGPSRREIELSKQRQALIARAEHAESSAFSALAETAEVGKQRDEALARVKELEKSLKSLEKADKSPS